MSYLLGICVYKFKGICKHRCLFFSCFLLLFAGGLQGEGYKFTFTRVGVLPKQMFEGERIKVLSMQGSDKCARDCLIIVGYVGN